MEANLMNLVELHEPSTPLLSHIETLGAALPITGSQRMESVPVPRRPVRGTERCSNGAYRTGYTRRKPSRGGEAYPDH